ncbi:MAG: ATP-dependent DNA helicase [Candidatus Diapherotrites archaeon]|nr:ATP-dependent DNA helicase [Candidatus Diapherotrites archaeon]
MFFSHERPRPHQKEMIGDVYKCVSERKHLLVHAPTGIGKTAAVLSPAITYALEENKAVFFLTPKISQHKIAVDEIKALAEKNKLQFTAADIVGRKYTCVDPILEAADHHSFYEICARRRKNEACQYYNNAKGNTKRQKDAAGLALQKIMENYGTVKSNNELVQECAEFKYGGKKHALCAYETAMQIARQSSVIVCDYFHVLYPHIAGAFMKKVGKKLEDSIIIVDEAQNASERIRSILSHSLAPFTLKRAIKEAGLLKSPLKKKLEKLKRDTEALAKKEPQVIKQNALPTWDEDDLEELKALGNDYLETTNRMRSACLAIHSFLSMWPVESQEYLRMSNARGVHHNCMDAGVATGGILKEAHSVIAMSGTLTPLEMYKDLLGFEEERTEMRQYESPFPRENRVNIISDSVTTRYAKRSDEQYQKIAGEVTKVVDTVPGNVAVFFPSYRVMREVLFNFKPNKPVYSQKERSTPTQAAQLLAQFRESRHFGAVLCAVAGGSFAEGIDYPGRDLMAAVVVGVPLAEWGLETQALVEYYEYKFGAGWNYGYLYPAMNRAIQAAGRVIRNEDDRGAIVFLDERFKWANYAKCFPQDMDLVLTRDPAYCVGEFFKQ